MTYIAPPSGQINTRDFATILTSRGPLLTKRWHRDAAGRLQSESYGKAKFFDFAQKPIGNLGDLADVISSIGPTECLIPGKLRDGIAPVGARRLSKDQPARNGEPAASATIEDVAHHWLAIDADSIPASDDQGEFDPIAEPGRAVELVAKLLPAEFAGADCVWQWTGSAGFKPGIRMRLFFWLDRPLTSAEMDTWLTGAVGSGIDVGIYSPAHVIYAAAPIFDGVADPCCGQRVGRLAPDGFELAGSVAPPAVITAPQRAPRAAEEGFESDLPFTIVEAERWLKLQTPAKDGTASDCFYRYGAKLQDFGLSRDKCVELLLQYNPSYDEDDIAARVDNAEKHRQNDIGCDRPKTDEEVFGDAAEWIEEYFAEHPGAQAAADKRIADLELSMKCAANGEAADGGTAAGGNPFTADDEVELLCAADVEPEEIGWLWEGHFALGKFHVLAGKPEAGKNLLCIDIAAALSVGGKWPDGTQAPLGDTIMWSGEDAFRDTTHPRFLAAGGDARRFFCVKAVTSAKGESRPFDPAKDVGRLCKAIRRNPNVLFLIIDPVSVVIAGGKGASNNNAETRRALQPLIDLAEERGIVVEGITHFRKSASGRNSGKDDVLERVIESTAFTAVARVVHVAHKFEDETKPRRWVRIKCNIAKSGGIVGFEYAPEEVVVPGYPNIRAPRLAWGEPLRGSARALIAEEVEPSAVDDATGFLETILRESGGLMLTNDLKAAAQANCHSWRSIERARDALGDRITIKQNAGATHAGWTWYLSPPKQPDASPF